MPGLLQSLARLIPARQKANPAGEGNWHPGPYTVAGGWLPSSWGAWNFWQLDRDPLAFPGASIVEACVWAYIRAIAQLPGYHRRELDNGGTETITTSALARLMRAPSGYQTPSDFLVHLIRSLLYDGNSYWIAQRNDRGEVEALHWTDPRMCRVREIAVAGQQTREIFYDIGANPLIGFDSLTASNLVVPARDVLHLKLATPRHPLIGETWLAALACELNQRAAINNTVTTAATTGRPTGILTTDLVLTTAQTDELRARWMERSATMAQGGVPILTHGIKFQPVALSAEDAATIEQLKLTDQMVAAVFGVPGILLGISDTSTQKSAEAVMAEWLAAGLGWLINHIEVALDQFLGLNAGSVGRGREYTELDTRALLRSAFKDRLDGLARGVQGGIYSPNEARRLEGLPAATAGDEPRVQQQVVPLSFATQPPAPPAPPVQDDEQDEEEARAIIALRLRREIDHAIERRAA